ncbi:exonuclease SbcC [Klebsiella pneumoniae]|nr:exonuclease SbcC [Klebsiella pneumoniae]
MAICRRPASSWRAALTAKSSPIKSRTSWEQTATLTGLDYGRFTRSMLLSQGQFAAFLNAKPSDRAELLEELTGTEIYGQISAMVYEQHKALAMRWRSSKPRRRASSC